MLNLQYNAIGLMSGTSLDGLDICLCKFALKNSQWSFELIDSQTIEYSEKWKRQLGTAHQLPKKALQDLSHNFGEWMGHAVNQFVKDAKHNAPIDLIGSHGHTVFHQPTEKFTLQIGNGPEIFAQTGITTVCDFRIQDVMLGGQGAPLVPIGDALLFNVFDACINLGGFANISLERGGQRVAFDICPANIVLNYFSEKMGKPFDEGGAMSRGGTIQKSILEQLNDLAFYRQSLPKSLGREWVEECIFPLIDNLKPIDAMRTFTEHMAQQIAIAIPKNAKKVLVTGGGAYNQFAMEIMREKCNAEFFLPDNNLINQKEAIIFAFLAVLRYNNLPNVLQSVTGAKYNHSAGRIFTTQ